MEFIMESPVSNHPDLFGGETPAIDQMKLAHESKYMIWKKSVHYRKSENKLERCGTCTHHSHGQYNTKYLHKCRLLGLTHSEATDIRVKNVCDKWELE